MAGVLEDRGSRIAYLAESENGRSLWLVDADGRNPRPVIDGVLGFDFYLDDNRVLYSRVSSEDEGPPELWARNLDTGEEVLLLRAPIAEIFTSRDGAWVGYCYGYSHFTQDIYRLRLEVPSSPIGLPSARGGQERVTFGEGTWHAHLGAFSPDGTSVAYSRDLDRGDIYIVENFK